MSKNIVFDLEHTLIIGINWRVLHPEAKTILAAANKDFDMTYLWTHCFLNKTVPVMKELGILKYFDGVVGIGNIGDGYSSALITFHKGKQTGQRKLPLSSDKDLSRLGDPSDFVLIEDMPTYGIPLDRVVEIFPYQGQRGHSLRAAYDTALKRFM
jgi:hypothetical protein